MRLIEEWKVKLGKAFFPGAVLMDLSKTFDCIPHDLLIAKLNVYGFERKSLVFPYSYLKWTKQCGNVNNIQSTFQTLLSRVPQRSILEPLLSNISMNDIIGFLTAFEKDITLLKDTLQNEAGIIIQ